MKFPYTLHEKASGSSGLLPFIPIKLLANSTEIETTGLIDSGSTINVLPYSLGLKLGLQWEDQKTLVPLTGNLAKTDAFGVVLRGQVADFNSCKLVFAWAKSDDFPLILGQTNFFQEFSVCFFRAELAFEVRLKG